MVFLSVSILAAVLCFSLLFALFNNINLTGILVTNLHCYVPPNKTTIEKAISELKENSKQKSSSKGISIPLASIPLSKDKLYTDAYSFLVNIYVASFLSLLVCVLIETLFNLFGKLEVGSLFLGLFLFLLHILLYLIFLYHREPSSCIRSIFVVGICSFVVSFIGQTVGLEKWTLIDSEHTLRQLHIRSQSQGLRISGEFVNFLYIFTVAVICALSTCCLVGSCQEQAISFSHVDREFEEAPSENVSNSFRRFLLRLDLIFPLLLAVFFFRLLQEDFASFWSNSKGFIVHSILVFLYLSLHLWSIRQYCQDFLNSGMEAVQVALAEKDIQKTRALPLVLRYLIENLSFVLYKYFITLSLLACVCLIRIRILSLVGSFPKVEETSVLFYTIPLACFYSVVELLLLWLLLTKFVLVYGSLMWNKLKVIVYK
ncbi:hypothetical protein Gasu_00500 isoform 1 [Galdieria sulphuraria]|uniref:Uncharacterized protein n=1 Tax=Galdieria sulphuraria TaxID=130081 RepID=M2X7Z9_GALSU|nr:hypothetical protein Gasu_00500 isoform 1 [Galdieria sulphuraria]EME32680.1 hypothetical protein Gasu_00500 isoform 1 [Galdieria sulphuraria]|eukprot:XP_005709200.1 hypothetical protein isoform 1 [Galdieria sulphuraria]